MVFVMADLSQDRDTSAQASAGRNRRRAAPVRCWMAVLLCVQTAGLPGCDPDRPPKPASPIDLAGRPVDPLHDSDARLTVLLFTATDCPISNRYAPEIRRLYDAFAPRGVRFWLAYPEPAESAAAIRKHMQEYKYVCRAVRDPKHTLVKLAGATVTPEAAVFTPAGELIYRGRIDDTYPEYGKARSAPTTRDLENALTAALAGRPVPNPRTTAVGCFIADLP